MRFPSNAPCIYNLTIPRVLENLTVCNEMCKAREMESVIGLFQSTNGKKWKSAKHWLNQSVPYCEWEGILCYNKTGHILSINLPYNNLFGYIPGALPNQIRYLLGICLKGNTIKSEDVGTLLSYFNKYLLRFELAYNDLRGTFPGQYLKTYPHRLLEKLQISGNHQVTGELNKYLKYLPNLQVLSLGETRISGNIHPSVGKLKKLWFLDLELLQLKGNLSILRNLSNLQYIHLMSNQLEGTIPRDFGKWFPNLRQLCLQNNRLNGSIPDSLKYLKELQLLSLAGNKDINGIIPTSLNFLHELEVLHLSQTNLEGFDKGFQLNSSKLASFLLSNNRKFSSSLNSILSVLNLSKTSLLQLDVAGSNIYGALDETDIFYFEKLTYLNLANNTLTGNIPDPRKSGDFNFLISLNVANNNLRGSLPYYLAGLETLLLLDIRGNPGMRGNINEVDLKTDHSLLLKEREDHHFSCPMIRFRHNNGIVKMDSDYYDRQFCQCDVGYYGKGGYCRTCMPGGECSGKTVKTKKKSSEHNNVYTVMNILVGYWPFPSYKNTTRLLKCNSSNPNDHVCNPLGNVTCKYVSLSKTNNDSRNDLGTKYYTNCGNAELCADGHTGRLCTSCVDKTFKDGTKCKTCPEGGMKTKEIAAILISIIFVLLITIWAVFFSGRKRKIAIILIIAEVLAVFLAAVFAVVPGWIAEINVLVVYLGLGNCGKSSRGMLKIGVFYAQIIDSLISTLHIWPKGVYFVQTFLSSVFNFQLTSLACYLPGIFTATGRLILLICLPFAAVVIIWTIYGLWYLGKGRRNIDRAREINNKCRHFCIVLSNLAYFPIVKTIISILAKCDKIDDISFMKNYAWISCDSTRYKTMVIIAGMGVPLYMIGLPSLFSIFLYVNREKIRDDNYTTKIWLGSLYAAYQPTYRIFMQPLLMLRRLFIALLLSVIPNKLALQTFLISLVFVIAIVLETHAKPFAVPPTANQECLVDLENIVEITSLTVLLVSFIAVRFRMMEGGTDWNTPLFWIIIVLNLAFIVFLIGAIVKRLATKENNQRDRNRRENSQTPTSPVTGSPVHHQQERSCTPLTPLTGSPVTSYQSVHDTTSG